MRSQGNVSAVSKVSKSSPCGIPELEKSLKLESEGAGKRADEGFRGGDIQTSPPQKLPSEIVKLLLPGLLPAEVKVCISLSDGCIWKIRLQGAASEKYSSKSDKQVEKLKSPADIASDAAELCLAAIAGWGCRVP